jgi:POT family proton-dependent oligopeptide transporter
MSGAAAQNQVDMAMSHQPKIATPMYEIGEKEALARQGTSDSLAHGPIVEFDADLEGEEPTAEELITLERVSGKIPWTAFTIAFVELCERFGYYGCQVVCMFVPLFRNRPDD